jgi:MarR family transcriptional regulator for hemolysin
VLKYDFEQSVGYWMLTTSRAFERAINEELAPHGITFRQCQVLGWLALEGDLSQVQLADRMQVEPPALVDLLDRMERCGWISRESCPGDRRKNLIRPRPDAEPIWAKVVDCALRVRKQAVQGLSPEEVQTLKRLLETIRENLNATRNPGAQRPVRTPA